MRTIPKAGQSYYSFIDYGKSKVGISNSEWHLKNLKKCTISFCVATDMRPTYANLLVDYADVCSS